MTHQQAGARGGRPRLLTLDELRRQAPEKREGGMEAPGSYRTLRRLYLQKGGQAISLIESPGKCGRFAEGEINKEKGSSS